MDSLGGGYALVHFMGSYLEVDLDDMPSTSRLFELIGRDGALRLHVPRTNPPINYMVDSQTLIFLTKMRNGLLNRNQTTWANTDTRLTPRDFYEPAINQKIAIRELGGGKRLTIPWAA